MQEAEEQDTCRICSAPAEPDQPLFHPCKCSGTIRYIHQDCLTTWLAHSKKKNCDVCKHPYAFTKVYAPDMPSSLPPLLLIKRLLQQLFFVLLFVLRALAVAAIWLGVLPWVTVWTWRMYFSMGESTAWWISKRPRPPYTESPIPFYSRISYEATAPPPKGLVAKISTHPLWLALSADIFAGQIIASLIVLTFVAIFLLREWISQNARPGVFEEEEAPPQVPAAAPAQGNLFGAQPRPEGNEGQGGLPQPEALDQQQVEAMRAVNAMRQNIDPDIAADPDRWHTTDENESPGRRPPRRKKNKARHPENDGGRNTRQKTAVTGDDEMEAIRRKMFHRRIHIAKANAARRKMYFSQKLQSRSPPTSTVPLDVPGEQMDFTFGPPSPEQLTSQSHSDAALSTSISEPSTSSALPHSPESSVSSPPPADEDRTSPFPSVSLEPPSGRTPIESPSLTATYHAPEELDNGEGPSGLPPGYFDNDITEREEYDEEEEEEEEEEDVTMHEEHEFGDMDEDEEEDGQDANMDHEHWDDSDVDMEAERKRYFREEGADEHEARGDAAGLPELRNISDSDDDSDDEHEGPNERPGHAEEEDDEDDHLREGEGDPDEEEEEDAGAGEDGLFDDEDGQWEVAEVEPGAVAQAQIGGGVGAVGAAAGNANIDPDAAAAAALAAEDAENNVEDDMEGAMEAIGMRGPIYGVLQNAALMIFVLNIAIGLGVWVPFTFGKRPHYYLYLDPHRLLQVLHLPIRAMRVVTDPFVDFIQWIIVDLFLPWVLRLLGLVFRALFFLGSLSARQLLGKETSSGISDFSMKLYNQSLDLVNLPLSQLSVWTSTSNVTQATLSSESNSTLLHHLPDYLGFTEPYFEALGREVRISTTKLQSTWIELALGNEPRNRVFAVFLGYLVITFLLCLYLNVLTVGNAKSAGRHVRNAVRQQLLVMKVATFIFIELVTFPLGCGIVLDLCTVWLFPEANMQSPMFYHWVAGTMFMYSFAVLLSGCRSVMRPGAMWFIKDPQDQNSHPIRDILDRPTLVQLRKICVSGIMYSFVVACVVGSVAGLVILGSKSIMPFRWKNREPLSNVPVDLLFLHLVLPYTMHYFRPKRAIKQVTMAVWKYLASRLRLTSYFFGGRHSEEEYTPKDWRDNFVRDKEAREGIQDGSFRRVPATDNLALPRDMRATVAVTADGHPVDDAARQLMAMQDAEAEKAKRTITDDYMVVYMPPQFRYRIMLFISLLWIFGAVCLGFAVALPIQLGRSFFRLFTLREVHDGYSFIVGFYLIWICYLVAKAIDRLDKRRQRRSGDGPRADLHVLVLKRGLLWIAKTIYMVVFLGIVIPVLLAIFIDLYIVLPIRFSLDPGLVPRIRVVDAWALGLLYVKIAMHAHHLQPPNRITRGLQRIKAHGWTRPDPVTATKDVIAPLAGGLLGMILLPSLIFLAVRYVFPDVAQDNRFVFMHVYPTVCICAGAFRSGMATYGMLAAWSQAIRDKEFLVEMRLKNHDPDEVEASDSAMFGDDATNVAAQESRRHILPLLRC
ncbi:hypothetical protein CPB84DRAFT_1818035 [Gymnopilus junonius]|uniref:RING-type E3 ubiquitin transferase n=1 Tax=Gymnopilus junonius TaxID=109634 RepID=A0A9P5N8W8_GYMJU|nr:hypothetical protein CPB84DRAFT_1818035 [Gymnopilus junonius]